MNYQTGESVVLFQRRKRCKEIALLLEALLEKHLIETIYVAWDTASMHEDDEIEARMTRKVIPQSISLVRGIVSFFADRRNA